METTEQLIDELCSAAEAYLTVEDSLTEPSFFMAKERYARAKQKLIDHIETLKSPQGK